MTKLAPALLFLAAISGISLAQESQLDASPSLFTVLAAINVAGFDAGLASASNHPARAMVRTEIAARHLPIVEELKRFYSNHRQKDETAEFSQYVSFALCVNGPPSFSYRFRSVDLPPDVGALNGLGPLLARFYREAGIEALWKKLQPSFDEVIARYHAPVSRAVLEVNGYLRNSTRGYLGRRFQIYIDLLGPPNQIHTRNYADDYFVVLTPSAEPDIAEVRHAYLFYLLDPLALKYSDRILKNKALGDFAQPAAALPDHYKSDFLLLTTASLIKAIESRLDKKPGLVNEALSEGYILAPFFTEQLLAYEKQPQSMQFYYPEMISALDLKKEDQRLLNVRFTERAPVRKAKAAAEPPRPESTGAEKTMQEAERLYAARDLDKAKQAYLKVLQETDQRPLHANACYGLARIAVLQKDPETAERLFQKTLELSPDPQIKAWTLVYLGRLSDAAGDREQAVRHYKDALAVDGASMAARKAAEKELRQSFHK